MEWDEQPIKKRVEGQIPKITKIYGVFPLRKDLTYKRLDWNSLVIYKRECHIIMWVTGEASKIKLPRRWPICGIKVVGSTSIKNQNNPNGLSFSLGVCKCGRSFYLKYKGVGLFICPNGVRCTLGETVQFCLRAIEINKRCLAIQP